MLWWAANAVTWVELLDHHPARVLYSGEQRHHNWYSATAIRPRVAGQFAPTTLRTQHFMSEVSELFTWVRGIPWTVNNPYLLHVIWALLINIYNQLYSSKNIDSNSKKKLKVKQEKQKTHKRYQHLKGRCGLEIFCHSGFRPSLPPRTKSLTNFTRTNFTYRPTLPRPNFLRPSLPAPTYWYTFLHIISTSCCSLYLKKTLFSHCVSMKKNSCLRIVKS